MEVGFDSALGVVEEAGRCLEVLAALLEDQFWFVPVTSVNSMLLVGARLRRSRFREQLAARVLAGCESSAAQFDESNLAAAEASYRQAVAAIDDIDLDQLDQAALSSLAARVDELQGDLCPREIVSVPEIPDARPVMSSALGALDTYARRRRGLARRSGPFGLLSRYSFAAGVAKLRENLERFVTDGNPLGRFEMNGAVGEYTTGVVLGLRAMSEYPSGDLPAEITANTDLDNLAQTLVERIEVSARNATVPFVLMLSDRLETLELRIARQLRTTERRTPTQTGGIAPDPTVPRRERTRFPAGSDMPTRAETHPAEPDYSESQATMRARMGPIAAGVNLAVLAFLAGWAVLLILAVFGVPDQPDPRPGGLAVFVTLLFICGFIVALSWVTLRYRVDLTETELAWVPRVGDPRSIERSRIRGVAWAAPGTDVSRRAGPQLLLLNALGATIAAVPTGDLSRKNQLRLAEILQRQAFPSVSEYRELARRLVVGELHAADVVSVADLQPGDLVLVGGRWRPVDRLSAPGRWEETQVGSGQLRVHFVGSDPEIFPSAHHVKALRLADARREVHVADARREVHAPASAPPPARSRWAFLRAMRASVGPGRVDDASE